MSGYRGEGVWWFRLSRYGPGLHVKNLDRADPWVPLSERRSNKRRLRLGRYEVKYLPPVKRVGAR